MRWSVAWSRSEEHTSELQSRRDLVCRLLLEKKKKIGGVVIDDQANQEKRREGVFLGVLHHRFEFLVLGIGYFIPVVVVFFFNDTATTEIYTLSLHDALPI